MIVATLTGLAAGSVHVFSGPDHLAAVAPLAVDSAQGAWRTGLRWGLGHSSGVILVGTLAVLCREILPIDAISSWSERMVGVVLIGIGLWGLRKALRTRLHSHEHTHDASCHTHVHLHDPRSAHPQEQPKPHVHVHAAFGIGALHGLAGGSHFLGVLPALAFGTRADSVAYLLAFGLGTILAMVAFSWVIGAVTARYGDAGTRAYREILCGCSIAATLVGVYWLVM